MEEIERLIDGFADACDAFAWSTMEGIELGIELSLDKREKSRNALLIAIKERIHEDD